jgi:hypothetical protein
MRCRRQFILTELLRQLRLAGLDCQDSLSLCLCCALAATQCGADKRYQRHDKRDKLPAWITQHLKDSHLNLSTDMLLCIARDFMRSMAQPYDRAAVGRSLLSEAAVNALDTAAPSAEAVGLADMQTDG